MIQALSFVVTDKFINGSNPSDYDINRGGHKESLDTHNMVVSVVPPEIISTFDCKGQLPQPFDTGVRIFVHGFVPMMLSHTLHSTSFSK